MGGCDGSRGVAYVLSAFLGERDPVLRLAAHLAGCRVLELPQGLIMIPFNQAARKASGATPQNVDVDSGWPFTEIDCDTAQRLARLAGAGKIAYVEAEYFGNAGDQSVIGW